MFGSLLIPTLTLSFAVTDLFSFCGASYYFGPFFGDPTSLSNYFAFFSVWKFRISKLITSMIPRRSSRSDGVPSSSSSLPGCSSRSLYMGGCSSHQGGLRVSSNVLVTPDFS